MKQARIPRSDLMILVGYFLARCTKTVAGSRPKPPPQLGCATWNDAYDVFFSRLGEGRTQLSFRKSLQNVRDTFDPLFENGRNGWRDRDTGDLTLNDRDWQTHAVWKDRSDQDLTNVVRALCGLP